MGETECGAARAGQGIGSAHPWAKLPESAVAKILSDLDRGKRQVDIAREHGICQATVSHIATGRRRRAFASTTSKVAVVAAYVRRKAFEAGRRDDLDDVYQEAALSALETRERYWRRMRGDPFNRLAAAAFPDANLATQRWRRPVSLSEGAATGRVKGDVPASGYESLFCPADGGGETGEERFGCEPVVQFALRGEGARRMRVEALLRNMSVAEQKMALRALEEGDVRDLAKRARIGVDRVARVLRRLVQAVGPDPAVARVARVISGTKREES